MNDKEQYENLDTCHVFLALCRKKDNPKIPNKKIMRRIIYDYEKDLKVLRQQCLNEGRVWRIQKTVNKRDMRKAMLQFRHTMLDTTRSSIESQWRKELLQPENQYSDFIMLDIDTEDLEIIEKIENILREVYAPVYKKIKSPNGWHYITIGFDSRLIENLPVSILKDGYTYVETVGEYKEWN